MSDQVDETIGEPVLTGAWRKATASDQGSNCVQVARSTLGVAVRDSKLGDDSPVLHFTDDEWTAFLQGAKENEFDALH